MRGEKVMTKRRWIDKMLKNPDSYERARKKSLSKQRTERQMRRRNKFWDDDF